MAVAKFVTAVKYVEPKVVKFDHFKKYNGKGFVSVVPMRKLNLAQ